MSEQEYFSILNQAKDVYLDKCKDVKRLKAENMILTENIRQLESDKNRLLDDANNIMDNLKKATAEIKRLIEKQRATKKFVKIYLTGQLNRMTEIEQKGEYNAEMFSYLVGDIGRSLRDAVLNDSNQYHNSSTYQNVTPTRDENRISPHEMNEQQKTQVKCANSRTIDNKTKMFHKHVETTTPKPPDAAACLDLGPPSKSSTQLESNENNYKYSGQNIVENENEIERYKDMSPILTQRSILSSPIGLPAKSSTPQNGATYLSTSSPQITSPSILRQFENEDLRHASSTQNTIPKDIQSQSPTIITRIPCTTSTSSFSSDHKILKRKRNDSLFDSLLNNSNSPKTENERSIESKTKLASKETDAIPLAADIDLPELMILDNSGFLKPDISAKKKARVDSVLVNDETPLNCSSLLFTSSQTISNTGFDKCKGQEDEQKDVYQPKIALNFTVEESSDDGNNDFERSEKKAPQFKYKEVVRGKERREKLNGYFCDYCQKYYGSLKLSETELQKRLKACSRHRARFSPPPNTPEHFWEVDFMNTDEYVERGFMRTGAELPPEKRQLKSRRLKLGKKMDNKIT